MKNKFRLISVFAALSISAVMLTACSGGGNESSNGGTSTAMPWETQTSQTVSTVQPSTVQPSTVQPSTVQPSTVQPSTVQPSTVQPSYVQPSYVQPSTVTPVGQQSIKDALEADMGIDALASSFEQQFGNGQLSVTGEYTSDDGMAFLMTLYNYVDPNTEEVRNMIATLATQYESLSSQMATAISSLETQYNVRPFTIEFRVCNADGSVLYTRTYSDQG
ncbi:MAG: hypothetical protein IJU51_01410 [Clostridia bacterium]|nr:hypothetical protein [Clostridia bacterium]